jgi:hypothetical protein
VRRDVKHIPPEELDGAVYLLLRDARTATDDELLTQIGRLFGIQRISAQTRALLDESLMRLAEAGRIVCSDDGQVQVANTQSHGSDETDEREWASGGRA